MLIRMNLLENSCDYLINALELYHIADEAGTHLLEKSEKCQKAKWKLSFISLSQGMELLLKHGLFLVNQLFVYSDIDAEKLDSTKTVSTNQSLIRLSHLGKNPFLHDENDLIQKCFRLRNRFIHYDVDIQTEELKKKFSKLYKLYKKAYIAYCGCWIELGQLSSVGEELEHFSDHLTIFRGQEIPNDQIAEYKAEIEKYAQMDAFIDSNGNLVRRIAFGEENYFSLCEGCEAHPLL